MDFENSNRRWAGSDEEAEWTEDSVQWTKETARDDMRVTHDEGFDFDAFLGQSTPERGRHEAESPEQPADGEDTEHEEAELREATDPRLPGYMPGAAARAASASRAPYPEQTAQRPAYREETAEQYAAREEEPAVKRPYREQPPPRPKVVVAEPAKQVYVTPPQAGNKGGDPPPPEKHGMGGGMKFLIALLLTAAIVLAVVLLAGKLFGNILPRPEATPTPSAPAQTNAPTPRPTDVPRNVVYRTVTVTAGSGGSVSPSGAVQVEDGRDITFTITPDEGYELTQLLIDGSSVSPQSSFTFSHVTWDHTLYAVFSPAATPEPTATPEPPPAAEATAEPPAATDVPTVPPLEEAPPAPEG